MTPLFPVQRAAEEFDQALGGTATADVEDRHARLLATVELLRAQPEVLPRPEFVTELRTRLMTAADTELVPAPAEISRHTPRRAADNRRRLATVAASLLVLGGTAGVATASSDALPGESLYPVKRGIEQVRAAAHVDPAGRGGAMLDQAATRLEEAQQLQDRSADPALVEETLQAFGEAAQSGSDKLFVAYQRDQDAAHVEAVRDFTARQLDQISELDGAADPRTSDTLIDAADTLADIDEQAQDLCRACAPRPPIALPAPLTAGAGAPSVATLLARPVAQAQADIVVAQSELDASIKELQAAVQKAAGGFPSPEQLARAKQDAQAKQDAAPGEELSSTITPDGGLVPSLVTKAQKGVDSLVDVLTRTLTSATDLLPPAVGEPLEETIDRLGKGLPRTPDDGTTEKPGR